MHCGDIEGGESVNDSNLGSRVIWLVRLVMQGSFKVRYIRISRAIVTFGRLIASLSLEIYDGHSVKGLQLKGKVDLELSEAWFRHMMNPVTFLSLLGPRPGWV